jgi:hypothetical protein
VQGVDSKSFQPSPLQLRHQKKGLGWSLVGNGSGGEFANLKISSATLKIQ